MKMRNKVKEVFVFENGNIALFDKDGEQITSLQEEINSATKRLWWKNE